MLGLQFPGTVRLCGGNVPHLEIARGRDGKRQMKHEPGPCDARAATTAIGRQLQYSNRQRPDLPRASSDLFTASMLRRSNQSKIEQ